MARSNWRNRDETTCSGCGSRMYVKDSKRLGGERHCTSCFKKTDTKSTITSIEDLPIYIKKYARRLKNSPNDIIIVFPYPTEITETDVKVIPIAKKFIKTNGGGYDDRGHWFIPLSKGKGWHEPVDYTGKAPEHVVAATRAGMKDILRQPLAKTNTVEMRISDGTIVYHGTASNFINFDFQEARRKNRRYTEQTAGAGIYFTSDKSIARIFADIAASKKTGDNPHVIKVELNSNAKVLNYSAPLKGNENLVRELVSSWWEDYYDIDGEEEKAERAQEIVDDAIQRSNYFEGSELGNPGTIGRAIEEVRVDLNDADLLCTESPGADLSNEVARKGYSIIHYETKFPDGHYLLGITDGKNYEAWLVLDEKGLKPKKCCGVCCAN